MYVYRVERLLGRRVRQRRKKGTPFTTLIRADRRPGSQGRPVSVNYPDLPRSGLSGPRLLRSGLPVSLSELAGTGPTAAPDSAGGFPLEVVRSVPLLPVGHSTTTDDARFLSRLNTAGDVVSIVLPRSTARVVKPRNKAEENDDGAVSPPYSLVLPTAVGSSTLVEGGGLAPAYS